MSAPFDPYHKWLGIPPEEQPPHHYRLLGIKPLESDPDVIESAADQRMVHLRSFQAGQYGALSQKLLNEVSAARLCLLEGTKKAAYDAQLRGQLAAGQLAAGQPAAKQPALPRAKAISAQASPAISAPAMPQINMAATRPRPSAPAAGQGGLPIWVLVPAGAGGLCVVLLVVALIA
ncbi:MAG TPA: hypothetical protein VFV87_22555, partial [Pirellulaceae bacterium]|nr:hypothetical protein [Pirellulaceae bacterium]